VIRPPKRWRALSRPVTGSKGTGVRSRITHELDEIAVRVPHIDARRVRSATTLSRDGPFDDGRTGVIETLAKCVSRSTPDEAQVPARRPRGGSAQREAVPLPDLWAMEVDHLPRTDVDGHDVGVLGDVEAERPIELDHRVGVLHRE